MRGETHPVESHSIDVLKVLGDNTRYAIFLELLRAPAPLATADIADTLDLHPNTVRPHLERMRDVGLLDVEAHSDGGVGRPQHRYRPAADAPALGLEPPASPRLAAMLLRTAAGAGADPDDALDAGRDQGAADASRWQGRACLDALVGELARMGFDPTVAADDAGTTVAFAHCPFRALAEADPDLVCALHRGMVEGFVDALGGGTVVEFRNLVHRRPCQVDLDVA